MLRHVVVVGGSLAGLRAVETLRTGGYRGAVTVVGAEPHLPYDRPPLSKRLLSGEWEPDRIALRKHDDLASLEATWRTGVAATRLDTDAERVHLSDGTELAYDGLVIATGSTPRRLDGQDDHPNSTVLRTVDDALALRAQIAGGGRRVVVVGAGFIGLEVAATARALGNDVVVLEAAEAPLVRALGPRLGASLVGLHADHGVEVRCGALIEGFAPGTVLVDGGWHEDADVVVIGIGVTPAIDWLADSGLELRDGIVCRADLNVGVERVYAAGDIVRWYNPLLEFEMRVEHWTNAAEQGALAATNLISEDANQPTSAYAPVPFFWSEQYDTRIQFLGTARPDDEVRVLAGSIDDRRFAAGYGRDGRLMGVFGMNMPRFVMPFRNHLMQRIGWNDALAVAATMRD